MKTLSDVTTPEELKLWESSNKTSAQLFDRAMEFAPGGLHHNLRTTWPFPLSFSHGEGPHKWDVDGHRYVDYALGQGSLLLGHEHPAVVEEVRKTYMPGVPGANHELEVRWSELVCDLIPSAENVRFVASGTEATMLAIRLARAYTGRTRLVRIEGHYDGWHDYVMPGFRPPFDQSLSAGVPEAILEMVSVVPGDDGGRGLEDALKDESVAAVILEPSGASWGTVPLEPNFCATARELATKYGSLMILDEVITGFRFSPGGAQARDGVIPDLTTLGKILCGGFHGGAVAGRADVLSHLRLDLLQREAPDAKPYVLHHGTFNGHPVSARAGIATLTEVKTGQPNAAADRHAAEIRQGLQEIVDSLSIAGFSYGESSVFHVYLAAGAEIAETPSAMPTLADGTPGSGSADELLNISPRVIDALHFQLRVRGVDLFSYNGGMTSATHGDNELDQTLSAFEDTLRLLRDRGIVAAS